MYSQNYMEAYIQRIASIPDQKINLAEVALALAAYDNPDKNLDFYKRFIERMEAEVKINLKKKGIDYPTLDQQIEILNEVLFDTFHYKGDEKSYDDIQNINLFRVIDRRKGLPIAIGLLYIHLGQKQGWDIEGINFPGHFLVRINDGINAAIVDPFHNGKKLEAFDLRGLIKIAIGLHAELKPKHYSTISNRDVLLRLQTNLKVRLIAQGEFDQALKILDTMVWIAPDRSDFWYESGFLNAEIGNFKKAISLLEIALNHINDIKERERVLNLLQQLRTSSL